MLTGRQVEPVIKALRNGARAEKTLHRMYVQQITRAKIHIVITICTFDPRNVRLSVSAGNAKVEGVSGKREWGRLHGV